MDNKSIIHGEIVPVITLTRRQIEEDWYTLHQQLARKTQECENWEETANQYAKNEEYYRGQAGKRKVENEKAEQKLERVREIIKQMNNECFYDDFDCKDCDMKNGCTYFNKSKILQIIEEKGD